MIVKIGGNQVSVSRGSMSISTAIEERSTTSFVVVDVDGAFHYEKGQPVEIINDENGNKLEFAGVIESSKEQKITSTRGLMHSISCVDWHYLADRRIIAKAYEDMYAGDIVKDLITTYLAQEGVTYDDVTTKYARKIATFNSNAQILKKYDGSLEMKRTTVSDTTPAMTSNTTPSPHVVSSNNNLSSVYKMFDNTTATGSTTVVPTWVQMDFGAGNEKIISGYSIKASAGSTERSPRTFEFRGYTPATGWVVLDSKSGLTTYDYVEFFFDNSTPYQMFKFNVTEVGTTSASSMIVEELQLFPPAPVVSTTSTITSEPIDLTPYVANRGNEITWTSTVPTGTTVKIETSIDGGLTWSVTVTGDSLRNFYGGEDLNGIQLLIRVTMTTSNQYVTPSIQNIGVMFNEKNATLQQGSYIEQAVFNYIPLSDAMNSLVEKTGFWWDIDPNKVLRFSERNTNVSPLSIDRMNIEKGSLSVEHLNPQYRNTQYIIGGKDVTDVQIETFKGNDSQQTFVVGYPVHNKPAIFLNDVDITAKLGIRGLDDQKPEYEWFWSKGNNTITQKKEITPIVSTDILKVQYQGEFDIVVVSKNNDQIANRQLVEGFGTGIVENVVEENAISSRSLGFKSANEKLERYGIIGRKINFRTWYHGLEAGQLLTVNEPVHDLIKTQLLIESVGITVDSDTAFYDVVAYESGIGDSWAKFFYKMANNGRTFVIRENIGDDQVLTTLETFSKTWLETDEPNIFKTTYPSTTTYPSSSMYPMFDPDKRVEYLSWYNGDREVGRKAITKTTVSADGAQITSICLLGAKDAVGTITHIGWWGGSQATSGTGTGVLLDRQVFDREKTESEAIEVDKIDTKGW
jgi:hypothetical protein